MKDNTLREEIRQQLAVAFNYGYKISELGGVNPGYEPNAELDAILAAIKNRLPKKRTDWTPALVTKDGIQIQVVADIYNQALQDVKQALDIENEGATK